MAITKEKAIYILERFDLFQGQRAGRELWNDKPFEVQEQDVKDFARDVALLKEYIADVAPNSEVADLQDALKCEKETNKHLSDEYIALQKALDAYEETSGLKQAKAEVAREIFEEIYKLVASKIPMEIRPIFKDEGDFDGGFINGKRDALLDVLVLIAELKKKYTEEKE